MFVYEIRFPDDSVYIGCTTQSVKKRVNNHLAKWRTQKFQSRKLYQKMSEFNCDFTHKLIGVYSNENAMYKAEEMYIAFAPKEKCLNNSIGGAKSKRGAKHTSATVEKQIKSATANNEYFEVICAMSGKILYCGNNQKEAAKIVGCTNANISMGLKRVRQNFVRKKKNTSKYIFKIKQGVGYPDLI